MPPCKCTGSKKNLLRCTAAIETALTKGAVTMKSDYLDPNFVAEEIGAHPDTVRSWCRSTPALATKVVGKWKIHRTAYEQLRSGKPLVDLHAA